MLNSKALVIVFMGSATFFSGCSMTPEISYSGNSGVIQPSASISELAEKFRRETPYFVNFGFDEHELDAVAESKLQRQATWILDHPNVKFRVYGHTDKVGSAKYNQDLALRRAESALAYFVARGINPKRLEAMVSFGEENPLIETNSREKANRRVETEVIGFVVVSPDAEVPIESTAVVGSSTAPVSPIASAPSAPSSGGTESSSSGSSTSASSENNSNGNGNSNSQSNSGRGNGDEASDPGNSGGHNNGGDE